MKTFHILIAEDDEDDVEMICASFKKSEQFYKIDTVRNGVELMGYLNTNRELLPHIILTDLNMPKKDGYEALREIFDDQDFKQIPIFVYSTTINPLYVERCMNMGVIEFLIKPFRVEEIDALPGHIITAMEKVIPVDMRPQL